LESLASGLQGLLQEVVHRRLTVSEAHELLCKVSGQPQAFPGMTIPMLRPVNPIRTSLDAFVEGTIIWYHPRRVPGRMEAVILSSTEAGYVIHLVGQGRGEQFERQVTHAEASDRLSIRLTQGSLVWYHPRGMGGMMEAVVLSADRHGLIVDLVGQHQQRTVSHSDESARLSSRETTQPVVSVHLPNCMEPVGPVSSRREPLVHQSTFSVGSKVGYRPRSMPRAVLATMAAVILSANENGYEVELLGQDLRRTVSYQDAGERLSLWGGC